MRKLAGVILIAIVLGAAIFIVKLRTAPLPPIVPVIAATQPATKPTTAPIAEAAKIASYIDVVRAANRSVPATQPLVVPVDLPDAAHVILHDAVYLDPLGHLWITRADAPPAEQALRSPVDPSEHLIPDRPVFVHWSANENGEWSAFVVTHRAAGGYEIISAFDRQVLADDRAYRWDCAFSWDGKIVAPTEDGVSIIEVTPKAVTHFHALAGMIAGANPPVTLLDSRGVLTWAPWENGHPGSHGASRFVDGKWSDLSAPRWPEKIVQLIPLLDGSILQVTSNHDDEVALSIAPLETGGIDEHHVGELVDELSDTDGDKRQAAFDELSRYGPGLWPILEKLTDEPPEARIRIKQLLHNKITPALNGMTLMDNRVDIVNRQTDGTVLLFAPVGVKIPNGDHEPQTVIPAWLAVHPGGRVDRPLPRGLIGDQLPTASNLYCLHDDWVICDGAGVRRFFGNALVPLVNPSEHEFTHILGVDRRGRWVLQKPGQSLGDTLIIDPTILDPMPRLPVWPMTIQKGLVGWTPDDYPVIKRGGAWVLRAEGWEALPEKAKIVTELPPVVSPPTSNPTTSPTTGPATTQSAADPGPPLLVTPNGTKYFDGRESLIVIEKSGKRTDWPLPAAAMGTGSPTLLRTSDGLLFLFNQAGRALRIKPTPDSGQPFELEATFTADIPNTEHPGRIWLDPLGRIDFVYDGNVLCVMFPEGHIPAEISHLIVDRN